MPVRQCVACGERRSQAALVRIRVEAGELVAGPGPGRSAYVCSVPPCPERALARGLLARRLRTDAAPSAALRSVLGAAALGGPDKPRC
jgi:predicted RNA-binding protein YlxR (DUF448 family)